MRTIARSTIVLLCLAAVAALGSDQNAPKAPLSLPFDFFSNQILLQVSVNGSEPVWFVLDSGASACVVDTALAQKLGIKTEGEKQGSGAGKGTVKFFAPQVTYGLPGLFLPVDESYVIDLSSQAALLGRYVGGILGYTFFAPYVADVDYDATHPHALRSRELPASRPRGPVHAYQAHSPHPREAWGRRPPGRRARSVGR